MRKILNTLYVTSPDAYLSLDGENAVVLIEDTVALRMPLHNLEGIVTFGYTGASPALMGKCATENISLCFMTKNGRFLARCTGMVRGNVTLRKEQYRISDNEQRSMDIAKNILIGKLYNSRWVLERAVRDHAVRINCEKLKSASASLYNSIKLLNEANCLEQLRGIEGEGASVYFSCFDDMILQQKETFSYTTRSRRPPLDNVNALLSFTYSLLTNDIAAALETVGLDAYVGFLHRDRPGRASLALDIIEEMRSVLADRFVLSLINKRIVNETGFIRKENGAIIMTDDTRRGVLTQWQKRKQEELTHPFLQEKLQWGLVPYAQALLLTRYIRGDLDAYPPFMWK